MIFYSFNLLDVLFVCFVDTVFYISSLFLISFFYNKKLKVQLFSYTIISIIFLFFIFSFEQFVSSVLRYKYIQVHGSVVQDLYHRVLPGLGQVDLILLAID